MAERSAGPSEVPGRRPAPQRVRRGGGTVVRMRSCMRSSTGYRTGTGAPLRHSSLLLAISGRLPTLISPLISLLALMLLSPPRTFSSDL